MTTIIQALTPVAFHGEYYTGRSSSILRTIEQSTPTASGGYLFYYDETNNTL